MEKENLKSKISLLETEIMMANNKISDKDNEILRIKNQHILLESSNRKV